jgi:parallel beta-helix repeat protein
MDRKGVVLRAELLEDRAVPAVYYVSTTGADANPGTGETSAWRTLQAAANRVNPSDTVIVLPGNYVGFNLTRDGTAAGRITFSARPGVAITSPNPWNNQDGINLEGADYVTIEGFNVSGMPRTGIRSVLNQFVTIRNNVLDNNGKWGILTGFSNDLRIEGNTATRSQIEHGIYVSNSGDRPVIRNNTIWGNRANGIHMNGDVSQGGDGVISGAVVENNVIHDNGLGGGSGINCDGVQNSRIQNNLIYNSWASGISLYRIDGGGPSSGNVVVNNTVIASAPARRAAGGGR